MAVVLLKVFEEANLSGELKLSGRKLKDFPKTAAKYNLSDTVIADLSRNRFCELPEDVTGFPFLETLLMYHNTLRSIPESIRGLHSLSFLDLRSNLLTSLPRELCFLPIQVLLVSNNRLIALPDELGRMEQLTELDAACNQITHLPARMSDLKNLKSLSLRNNHLVYLPRDVTSLNLVSLDISCNRIAALPVELRLMTSLVSLELSSNPLTSPPASLCVRGLVHVFKYLDTMAAKEEKSRNGTLDGNTTLRRNAAAKNSSSALSELQRIRRQNVDSGYSTSDGFDKRWSQEMSTANGSATVTDNGNSKWSPTQVHNLINSDKSSPVTATSNYSQFQPQTSGNSTPSLSPAANNNNSVIGSSQNSIEEYVRPSIVPESSTPKRIFSANGTKVTGSNNNSNDVSPDGDFTRESQKSGDKYKSLGNIQTYREYKEALRQQRNQDSHAIYRPKDPNPSTGDTSPASTQDSPSSQVSSFKSNTSTPSSTNAQSTTSSNTNSPLSPRASAYAQNSSMKYVSPTNQSTANTTISNGTTESVNSSINNSNGSVVANLKSPLRNEKPIQKVTPSRNSTPIKYHQQVTSPTNGNSVSPISSIKSNLSIAKDYNSYVKPSSPAKPNTISANGSPLSTQTALKTNGSAKTAQKSPRSVSWNRDIPAEKLSFTMRREFDRQKEETELIDQLKMTIESRLKMSLPKDVASALTDGVVLCHLANHVRPRSVASIHVPSPAVPKLTMARCRRNVDNFLDACRKIGVDEELICSCADIVPADDLEHQHHPKAAAGTEATRENSNEMDGKRSAPNPLAMFRTIAALIDITGCQSTNGSSSTSHSQATNTNTGKSNRSKDEIDNYNQYFKKIGIHFQKHSLHLLERSQSDDGTEAEDDSDKVSNDSNEYSLIDNYECIEFVENQIEHINSDAMNNDTMPSRLCNSKANANNTNIDLIAFCGDEVDHSVQQLTEFSPTNKSNHSRRSYEPSSDKRLNNNSKHSASNNNNNNDECTLSAPPQRRLARKAPNTLDLIVSNTTILNVSNGKDTVTIKKRKLSNLKRSYNQINVNGKYSDRFPLNGIVEECEYDSDIGKFNCKVRGATNDQLTSDNSSGSYEFSEDIVRTSSASSGDERGMNDLNVTPKQRNLETDESIEQFNINESIKNADKIVMKRIEFFESVGNKIGNDSCNNTKSDDKNDEDTQFSTILCLTTFVLVVVVLYNFPLPN